ncbi:MAG: zinc-ribbon domain-containing protein [Smithellaceae bacterium]|nr:zinc-ribbon domain-containing protein [Smithellaceae bacterium]
MIIQCKQCRTKFRFDDAKIAPEGIWVRCNRCQHVFFQEPPKKMQSAGHATEGDHPFEQKPVAQTTAGRLAFEPAGPPAGKSPPDEDLISFLQDVMETERMVDDERKEGLPFTDPEGADAAEAEISGEFSRGDAPGEALSLSRHRKNRSGMFALWTLFVVAVVPALIYFVFFPALGERLLKAGGQGWENVLSMVGLSRPAEILPVTALVRLQDVRQRVVENYILGPVRIVEGKAVNQAEFPISRVQVKAEILDAYAVVLGEQMSYAGNVLNDDELVTMTEEEMKIRLSLPEGQNNANDRVEPGGRISFMVVFTGDPPGMIKTVVKIVGAERLL